MKALNPDAPKAITPEELQQVIASGTQVDEKGIEFDMAALIHRGTLERTVEVLKGINVTMHVLTHGERKLMAAAVAPKNGATNLEIFEELKTPTLQAAITKLGNKEFITPEQKKELGPILNQLPSALVDLLYIEYQKLIADQLQLLEDGLKKNS